MSDNHDKNGYNKENLFPKQNVLECLFNQNKNRKLSINDNDAEWLSNLIDCLQFFY